MSQRPNRRERREANTEQRNGSGLKLKEVRPLTSNQQLIFKSYFAEYNLFLHGIAGSGKTFLALYLALTDVLVRKNYRHLVIIRSAVSSRNIGFLPGNNRQKVEIYELPYMQICSQLFEQDDAYRRLKALDYVRFESTSFLRGLTIDDSVIVVDETQNLTFAEINTIITRVGSNSRLILCGDIRQNDIENVSRYQTSCFDKMFAIIKHMPSFRHIELMIEDCVRSGVVKEWLQASEMLRGRRED